jgi:hypothetical protein
VLLSRVERDKTLGKEMSIPNYRRSLATIASKNEQENASSDLGGVHVVQHNSSNKEKSTKKEVST